jgi:sugar/nucleoside kinase (ribokinase family)
MIAQTLPLLRQTDPTRHRALIGLDGYVDKIIRVVDRQDRQGDASYIPDMNSLANRIANAAGKSAALELHVQQTKLGGNGPIMANALATLGLPLTCMGAFGTGDVIHPAFLPMAERCKLIPLSKPARTSALEFDDGKLMLQESQTLDTITFDRLLEVVGKESLQQLFEGADFVAMNNWVSLVHMDRIWTHLQQEICPVLSNRQRVIFFDLADPEKRVNEDLLRALRCLAGFNPWYRTTLGLNEKESEQIAQVLGLELGSGDPRDILRARAAAIRAAIDVDCVVIHPVAFAAAADKDGSQVVDGPYIAKPLISTGAGDHFNAGFSFGRLIGGDLGQALQIGVATSGYYVRSAQSPSVEQLIGFLEEL